jgi:hypothetical protein
LIVAFLALVSSASAAVTIEEGPQHGRGADFKFNFADAAGNVERVDGDQRVRGERLDHYIETLRLLSESRPELPFLSELSEELAKLVDREAGT